MRPLIFLFCAVGLLAQQQSTQQAEKKGSISGVVINAATKEPIRRAEVSASTGGRVGPAMVPQGGQPGSGGPSGARRAVTDNEGKFTIVDLGAGAYNLSARRNGMLDARYGAKSRMSPGAQVNVSDGQNVTGIRLEMMPQAVIAGKIVDEEGEPQQGIMVQLTAAQSSQSPQGGRGRPMIGGAGGRTDDRGEFRVPNVAPGTYILQISPNRGTLVPTSETDANLAYVPMYYPGVFDRSQAEKIKVTVGAELSGLQMRLQKTRVYKVQGTIVDADGQAPRGYFVSLVAKGSAGFGPMVQQQFNRGANGAFELRNVTPGSYNLMVRTQGGQRAITHREPLEVGSQDIQNLTVRITPPVTIAGQVLASTGAEQTDLSRVRVFLTDAEGAGFGGGMNQSQTKQDGTFSIENVSPGRYRVNVFMPNDAGYIESIRAGEQDITGQEFAVSSAGAQLRVIVGANGGTVGGTVIADGNPSPGATVVLLPVRKELREQPFLRTGATDQNASFTIKNVAPGDYLLMALEEYDPSILDDETQFQIIERKAKKISVSKGGSESAALELIRSTT